MEDYNIELDENEEFVADEFIVYLTIEGTAIEGAEVKLSDPTKTIRDQIASIVKVFELAKMDAGGNPIQYQLGMSEDEGGELTILQFEDEDGREQCLDDYNIQPGDHLTLIKNVIPG